MTHQLVAHVVHPSEPHGLAEAARAVAAGLGESMEVRQHPAQAAPRLTGMWLDLLVVGVAGPGSDAGLQRWLHRLGEGPHSEYVATFETRRRHALLPSGWSARATRRALAKHGYTRPAGSRTFTVERRTGELAPGEWERARDWGRALAWDMTARDEGRFVAPPGLAV